MKARIAGLVFLLFILLVILAADMGRMPSFVRKLYDFPNGDRVGHVVLYGILAFLLSAAFPGGKWLGRIFLPTAIIVLLGFATLEEGSQSLFSTRTADFIDLACSWVGICGGAWAANRWKPARKAPEQSAVR
jgi:asparagine N-glycosylation enzyme membrane subunit Stt3